MSTTPMLTASEARGRASNDRVIFDECRSIESAILDSVDMGGYETFVIDGTTLTNISVGRDVAMSYYATWVGVDTDRAKTTQMNAVISYFTNLGYSIERRLNSTTYDTFIWYVVW